MLRGEGGDAGVEELLSRHGDGVSDGEDARVKDADHVSGVGLLHDFPLCSHQLLGLGQAHLPAALHMVVFCVPLELAGANPHKGQPVPVGLVHVGLNLENKGGEVRGEGIHHAAVCRPGQGRRGELQEGLQERLNAEVGKGGAKEHGAELSAPDGLHIHLPSGGEKLHIINELLVLALAVQKLSHLGVVQINLLLAGPVLAGDAGEEQQLPVLPVVNTLEVLAAADGPVHGVGLDAQLPFHLVQQVEGVPGLPVHLVDEGENGDVAHGADLEQLPGLGLHALGAVNHHDGGVRSHKGTVGVLGEVLVTGGVQNVDAVALVLKLHDRAGDGDTTLLFNLHPVGGGGPGIFLALDHTGLGNGAAVQQEFFC